MRRYGKWAGKPNGVKENVARCAAVVYPNGSMISAQCNRKRVVGLFCKQHAKMADAGRYVRVPEDL